MEGIWLFLSSTQRSYAEIKKYNIERDPFVLLVLCTLIAFFFYFGIMRRKSCFATGLSDLTRCETETVVRSGAIQQLFTVEDDMRGSQMCWCGSHPVYRPLYGSIQLSGTTRADPRLLALPNLLTIASSLTNLHPLTSPVGLRTRTVWGKWGLRLVLLGLTWRAQHPGSLIRCNILQRWVSN